MTYERSVKILFCLVALAVVHLDARELFIAWYSGVAIQLSAKGLLVVCLRNFLVIAAAAVVAAS